VAEVKAQRVDQARQLLVLDIDQPTITTDVSVSAELIRRISKAR